jgi:acyl-CoA reductase-like NAD-dependent aldehyde dehydrogenase
MRKLFYLVDDNKDAFVKALDDDLARPVQESLAAEITVILMDIINVVKNVLPSPIILTKLDSWAKDDYVPVDMSFYFNKCRVRREPLGVVLVMGPWNYPVWCNLCPVLYAMAAGNTVILKPSEHAAASSALLAKLIPKYFSPEYITVVTGAIPVASTLLKERYDHIVYTGGTAAAHFVTAAAAKHLTPYTLELGGKNPCIVDASVPDSKLELFATRIMWGKFTNAGQICVGSDHIIVVGTPEREEKFLAYAKKAANKLQAGGDMGRIINESHFGRLEGLLRGSKGQVVHGGDLDRERLRMGITIVKDVEEGDTLMGDEIFGPLLPVLRFDTLDEATSFVRKTETPLTL